MVAWNGVKRFFGNPIIQFIGWPGVAIVITWLATNNITIPIWVMWLIFLFVIACTLSIMNQVSIWRERHQKGFTTQSNENMESVLRKWLDKRQYPSQHMPNEQNLFFFVVTDKQNRPINVMRPKDNPAVIRLAVGLDEVSFENIPQGFQESLRFQIGVEMARFGLLYKDRKPVVAYLDLPCDDLLTENVFLNAIDKTRQAFVLMSACILAVAHKAEPQKNQS